MIPARLGRGDEVRVASPASTSTGSAGGKFVERWYQIDRLGLVQQLGVIPAPGQSEEAGPT